MLLIEDSWIDEIVSEAATLQMDMATAAGMADGNDDVVIVVKATPAAAVAEEAAPPVAVEDCTGEVVSAGELILLVPEVLRRWIAAILSPEKSPEAGKIKNSTRSLVIINIGKV